MKKWCLPFLSLLFAAGLLAQSVFPSPTLPKQHFGFNNKLQPPYIGHGWVNGKYNSAPAQAGQQTKPANVDNMPVADKWSLQLTFSQNNLQGTNLYSATPDNMPVVMPDSTFYAPMPVASSGLFITRQPALKATH